MFIPYNVDRVTKKVAWCTYSLMGINALIFLVSIMISNLSLNGDREAGQAEIKRLTQNIPLFGRLDLQRGRELSHQRLQSTDIPSAWKGDVDALFERTLNKSQMSDPNAISLEGEEGEPDMPALSEELMQQLYQLQALSIVSQSIKTPDDYRRLYLIIHAYDSFTDSPHYSVLNAFAYRPNTPSVSGKFMTMFTSMFLHSNFEHLTGNLLFLWIFGRATEEFLGVATFVVIYLSSGVAATFLQHIMTMQFAPNGAGNPNLGASGAIAGVLGLFAVRFYRTKVRVFYLWGWATLFFAIIGGFATFIFYALLQEIEIARNLGFICACAALYVYGRGNTWGAYRVPSVWVVSIWVVFLNLLPALWQMIHGHKGGGVAYWAHIGGLVYGAFFALIIGGVASGKDEYALEDAKTALQTTGSEDAIRRAGALLQKNANDPEAHEVAAQGYNRRGNKELAAQHFNAAIEGYWKSNQRDGAARLYGIAVQNDIYLNLRPALLLSLSNHYAQNSMWNDSASILTRIVDENPDVPEAEIALLRAAGIWLKQYDDPAESLRMVQLFNEKYPMSTWEGQVKTLEATARRMLAQRGGS